MDAKNTFPHVLLRCEFGIISKWKIFCFFMPMLLFKQLHNFQLLVDERENLHKTSLSMNPCDALRDLASFVQFKKREKHPWRGVTFSKVAGI